MVLWGGGRGARRPESAAAHGLYLSNRALEASFQVAAGELRLSRVLDRATGRAVSPGAGVFAVVLEGGRVVPASELTGTATPEITPVSSGKQISAEWTHPSTGMRVKWRAVLLDGTRYLRQELVIQAGGRDLPVREIVLWDCDIPGIRVIGTVKGSPACLDNVYFGFEHPLSVSTVSGNRLRCSLPRQLPIRAGQSFTCSSVIGATEPGQLRRGFLEYLEAQRAHPYRTFLHYNSWYDLGYFSKYDEAGALDRINAFGAALHQKRGVVLDSYLFDDGWDDTSSLWDFHSGFPDGFAKLRSTASSVQAGIGVWLSPWGGYGKPKKERILKGEERGFEIKDGGFALSGPHYYRRFHDICFKMVDQFGVNQFKFDGTGNADRVIPGSRFDSDFDAAISLIADLRARKPNLFVNLTTGTYPSPFWLRFADSIWRDGEDHDFAGVGSWRQRWITYRDAMTYQHNVVAGPLYPLNSLMLHGLIYADHARNLSSDPEGDFRSEIRSYFGTGTQLQEMYISPHLLSERNWDDLAEAARWSRANADTLVDTHWIGGDPAKLAPYGWASWSPRKGIIVLRNPSDKPQMFSLDIQQAWELPSRAPTSYRAASPWKEDSGKPSMHLAAGNPVDLELAPFEVITLDAPPDKS